MKKGVTIYQIAKEAGVSGSTVARVLNGGNKENWKGTAKRGEEIRRIAEKLGYRPNWRAKALANGRTHTIGVLHPSVVPGFRHQYWHDIVQGLADDFHSRGYDIQFIASTHDTDRCRKVLLDQRCEGCVVLHELMPGVAEALEQAAMPVVLLNAEAGDYPGITPDDVQGSRLATEHLLALGHRRLVFVDTHKGGRHFSFGRRREGFRQALRDAGLEPQAELIHKDLDSIMDAIESLDPRPTGVVAYDDGVAMPLLHACWRRGVRVPEQLSVVAFNDSELTQYAIPPVTTIAVPGREMAARAAALLLSQIEPERDGPAPRHRQVLPETLVVRESTAPPGEYAPGRNVREAERPGTSPDWPAGF